MSKISNSSISLHRSTTEANSVAWSRDQRIAVTASEAVYVLTLRRPQLPAHVAEGSAKIPPKVKFEGTPLFVINTAHAPFKEKLAPLEIGGLSRVPISQFPRAAKWNVMNLVDPILTAQPEGPTQSRDLFKVSYWTPPGYNHLGGCVLTVVTASGRVLLFTPPGSTGNCWKLALDVTAQLSRMVWGRGVAATPKNKMRKTSRDSKTPSTTTEVNGSESGVQATTSNGVGDAQQDPPESSDTVPNPKRPRLTSTSDDYVARKLSLASVACCWLPTLLLINCKMIGIVAVTTRSGHVTLLGVKLPIVAGKIEEDPITLLCHYKLPLASDDSVEDWGSSLCWLPSSSVSLSTPTFYLSPTSNGCVHGQLVVGCTNGQVHNLRLKLIGEVGGRVGLVSSDVHSVNSNIGVCRISGVTGVTGCVSMVTTVWVREDRIPVYSIVCQPKPSTDGSMWVVFSKSHLLVAKKFGTDYTVTNAEVKISGHHKTTVSGLSAFSESSFLSSGLDGTVQRFTLLPSSLTTPHQHVTPTPIAMEMCKRATSQGLGVSESGIFAAVAINLSEESKRKKSKKLRIESQLHFVTIATPSELEGVIRTEASGRWDMCEYLRKHYMQHHSLLPSIHALISQKAKSKLIPIPKLQFLFQISVITGKFESAIHCKEEIMHRYICASLESWVELERNQGDSSSRGHGDKSQLCARLMAQWLMSCAQNRSVQETELANKVLGVASAQSTSSTSSSSGPSGGEGGDRIGSTPLEVCQACGEPVPLTNYYKDSCRNGHSWSRCTLTLSLAVDARCSSCIQCGTIVNNALTIRLDPGSWLGILLHKHSSCIICGGYYEQVI